MTHPTAQPEHSTADRRPASPLLATIVRHSYHAPRHPWAGAIATWSAALLLGLGVAGAGALATWRGALPQLLGAVHLEPVSPNTTDVVDSVEITPPTPVAAQQAAAPSADPASTVEQISVGRGDTLVSLLSDAGAPRDQVHGAVEAIRPLFDPRDLKEGQPVNLIIDQGADDTPPRLVGLAVQTDADRVVRVQRDDTGGFTASEERPPLTRSVVRFAATIDDSLYGAASQAGLPVAVTTDVIRAFSYDIDFQRDIHAGDRFEVLVERFADDNGATVKWGDFLFARLVTGADELIIYRYAPSDDGIADFFTPKGDSVRKALLRTPIDGARISSGFGMRRHPILGYSKMHKGIDFAAPTGTPVLAAGDGVIDTIGLNGSYGNYVRLRHSTEYSTAYAHLSRFAKGLKPRQRIRQGDVIGYVGTTGRSTGPHLHYEILTRGRQVNPAGVKFRSGRSLAGKELVKFKDRQRAVDRMLRDLPIVTAAIPDAPPLLATPHPSVATAE